MSGRFRCQAVGHKASCSSSTQVSTLVCQFVSKRWRDDDKPSWTFETTGVRGVTWVARLPVLGPLRLTSHATHRLLYGGCCQVPVAVPFCLLAPASKLVFFLGSCKLARTIMAGGSNGDVVIMCVWVLGAGQHSTAQHSKAQHSKATSGRMECRLWREAVNMHADHGR